MQLGSVMWLGSVAQLGSVMRLGSVMQRGSVMRRVAMTRVTAAMRSVLPVLVVLTALGLPSSQASASGRSDVRGFSDPALPDWGLTLSGADLLGTPCAAAGGSLRWGGGRRSAVIDSFSAPGSRPAGVDWAESVQLIYHVDEGARGDGDRNVWTISPGGAATVLFNVPAAVGLSGAAGNDLTYVEERDELVVADYLGHDEPYHDAVYRFSISGEFIRSYDVAQICSGVIGICWDGESYWLSGLGTREIVQCDTSFAEVSRHAHPGGGAGALDYDPDMAVFYVSDYTSGRIYICDETMAAIDTFNGPGPGFGFSGVAVGRSREQRTLWCASASTGVIYEIEDEYSTPVERLSWGAVKSRYR